MTDQNVLARRPESRIPSQVFAKPLLDENAKESGGETKNEAEKPEDVDP